MVLGQNKPNERVIEKSEGEPRDMLFRMVFCSTESNVNRCRIAQFDDR